MFTGLVQAIGTVIKVEQPAQFPDAPVRLTIDTGSWDHKPRLGDSVSVAGVCLTVAERPMGRRGVLTFFAVAETLDKTTLRSLRLGSRVNLEHALTPSTLLGGHLVQGHIDGRGKVVSVQKGLDWRVRVRLPKPLREFVVDKGSVCVDGASLTIARTYADGLEVALIPTTLELTTLGGLAPRDEVNIETDMVVKTIVSWARRSGLGGAAGGKLPRARSGR